MANGMPLLIPKWVLNKLKEVGTHLTKAEYDALPAEKKVEGTYFIDDYNAGVVVVDQALSTTSTNAVANQPVATAISQINQNLSWTLIQTMTSQGTQYDVPNLTQYRELCFMYSGIRISYVVPTASLSFNNDLVYMPSNSSANYELAVTVNNATKMTLTTRSGAYPKDCLVYAR